MRGAEVLHSSPVHFAILRAAGLLVPGERRTEWLAEWRAELWYASVECSREAAGLLLDRGRLTAFCLGSFKDALWLRRNTPHSEEPVARRLDSPMQCIGFLAAIAALGAAIACLLWVGTRATVFPSDLDSQGLFPLLFTFLFPLPILPAITSLSLGELHGHGKGPSWRLRLRRWAFLSAKVALILVMLFCGLIILGCDGMPFIPPQLQMLGLLGGYVLALRWALNDQRHRCPVCLRLLTHPVWVGDRSRYFLEWNCTELVCPRAHGLMYVPERPASWFSTQRWLSLDASWSNPPGNL
jgi:hypothetical protein